MIFLSSPWYSQDIFFQLINHFLAPIFYLNANLTDFHTLIRLEACISKERRKFKLECTIKMVAVMEAVLDFCFFFLLFVLKLWPWPTFRSDKECWKATSSFSYSFSKQLTFFYKYLKLNILWVKNDWHCYINSLVECLFWHFRFQSWVVKKITNSYFISLSNMFCILFDYKGILV